ALNDFSRKTQQLPQEAIDRVGEFLADRVKGASVELVRLGYLGKPGDGRWTVEFDQALKAFKYDHTSVFRRLFFGPGELALSEVLMNDLKTEVRQQRGPRFDEQATDKRTVGAAIQGRLGIRPDGAWGPKSQEKLKAFFASQGLDSDGSLTV